MDDAGGLGGGGAPLDGPGAGLLGTGREVGLEAEGVEADAGEGGEAGLFGADRLQQFHCVLLVELGEVRLQLGVEEDRLGGGDQGALLVLEGVVDQLVLVDVEDVEEGLRRQKVQVVQGFRALAALDHAMREERVALLQDLLRLLDGLDLGGDVLLDPRLLLEARQDLLDRLEVGEDQLGVDRLDVVLGRDLAVDVDDVLVLEGADDLADRVGLPDVRQELVAQALALARAAHDARDVDEVDGRREDPLRVEDLRQLGEAGVGDADHAHVGLDRGERVVGRQHVVLGQGVEQGRLADIRQTDDSDRERHVATSRSERARGPGGWPIHQFTACPQPPRRTARTHGQGLSHGVSRARFGT
ncbi:hypothetical protein SAURM35S_07392 [Streptomyces aurantiogriseus]